MTAGSGPLPSRAPPSGLRIAEIQTLVAKSFDLERAILLGTDRHAKIALARHVAMYLAYSRTRSAITLIGRCFGGRDHTTVIHAVRRIDDLRTRDGVLRRRIERIESVISGITRAKTCQEASLAAITF